MKNLLLLYSIVFLLSACNHTNNEIKKRIENADSAAINYFKGDGSMDTVVAVKIITDKAILAQLTTFISEASIHKVSTCGINGSLHFFKMDRVVQDIDFAMDDNGCNQFNFRLNFGEAWSITKLSPEAKALLISLKKK